jgi:uncharacterized membrane protein YkvA (DUF1232 family)
MGRAPRHLWAMITTLLTRFFIFRKEVVQLWRAFWAPQTPLHLKAATLFVAFYLVNPLDILPDFIPLLGWVDDIVLVPLMVSWIVSRLPRPVYAGKYGRTVDGQARRL